MRVLSAHDTHESNYSNDVLAMNTTSNTKRVVPAKKDILSLNEKIDISLEKYKNPKEKSITICAPRKLRPRPLNE